MQVSQNTAIDPKSSFKHLLPEIKELSQLSPVKMFAAIAIDWSIIIGCFWVALASQHALVWVLAGIIISGRQHALLVLMHDAVHGRFLTNAKQGIIASNLLCSWPLFIETAGFKENHLPHHRNLNTEGDPDLQRKLQRESEWDFPMARARLFGLLLRDLLGGGLLDNLKAMRTMAKNKSKSQESGQSKRVPYLKIAYYAVVFGLITYGQLWIPVLLLWFIPAFTLLAVHLRVKAIAEHFGLEEGDSELHLTRNYFGPIWESSLFFPHNINYHLDHHLFPSVPFYNLPRLNQLLAKEPAYSAVAQVNTSFFGKAPDSIMSDLAAKGVSARALLRAD